MSITKIKSLKHYPLAMSVMDVVMRLISAMEKKIRCFRCCCCSCSC